MEVVLLGYLIFACLLFVILGFNYVLVKYYTDPSESYCLATLISTLSLSVTLLAVLLVPVDILAASGGDDLLSSEVVGSALLALFVAMLLLAFLLIPFTYFFGEERADEFDSERDVLIDRVCESLKSTLWYALICAVLILVGLVLRPQKESWSEGKEWVRQLFDADHAGEAAI